MRLRAASIVLGAWGTRSARRSSPTSLQHYSNGTVSYFEECAPINYPVHGQCAHVKSDACAHSDTLLGITYPEAYYCAAPAARPGVIVGLIFWLAFLFSFIGIAASDFFIPNLATLSDIFGLDDNIAGVTFLAFGNGSPDLFSTLSAMRKGSGSLAIGELIGAASFIVSVVAGTMCIMQSFTVNPIPFLRDVGFFSLAMGLLFWILYDGLIEAWEAGLLAGLYVLYVLVVIGSTWWDKRRERKMRALEVARQAFEHEPVPSIAIYVDEEPYRDDDDGSRLVPPEPDTPRQRSISMPGRVDPSTSAPGRRHSEMTASEYVPRPSVERSPSSPSYNLHRHDTYHHPRRPGGSSSRLQSFSLIGALEFRNIVHNLQRDSGAAALKAFDDAAGNHHNAPHLRRARKSSHDSSGPGRGLSLSHMRWDDDVELGRPGSTSPPRTRTSSPGLLSVDTTPLLHPHHGGGDGHEYVESPSIVLSRPETILEDGTPVPTPPAESPDIPFPHPSSPSTTVSAFPFSSSSIPSLTQSTPSRSARYVALARRTGQILFPTLVELRTKSWFRIAASVLAAPAVLFLTATLPVVITEREDHGHGHHGHVEENGYAEEDGKANGHSNGNGHLMLNNDTEEGGSSVDDLVREGHLIDLSSPLPRPHPHPHSSSGENTLRPPLAVHPSHHSHTHSRSRASSHSSRSHSSHSRHSSLSDQSSIEQLIDDAESEVLHELHGGVPGSPSSDTFNKYLTGVQLILGPLFCISVCFVQMPRVIPWLILASVIAGVAGAVLVLVFARGGKDGEGEGGNGTVAGRLALCLLGFVVAMVWIMAIADEVVQVLNTFGFIFGLSDAIIGLTIFAIGNSLADLVADVTVAAFAPIMGFSACFGGPMLNILFGIGLSGTYVIAQTGQAYPVEFGNTLLVSCVGLLGLLLGTLVWVPWNGYHLDRRWGIVLILSYAGIMTANVLVEVFA